MRRVMKTIFLTVMALTGLMQPAWAYSLSGPTGNGGDSWQTTALGVGAFSFAPKNLGEEYRRNTPVMFYTYDEQFETYFTGAEPAIDKAFTILNQAFTNSATGPVRGLDGYSYNLSEFPLETRHINYQAQALGIVDVKTLMLNIMVQELGLTDPVINSWILHDRYVVPPNPCPTVVDYLVVQRNFDYVPSSYNTVQYTPYVNDVLYSYQIVETCVLNPVAYTVPYSVDPLADIYSPVASMDNFAWGHYVTGLTRDDAAGLRYLLQTNNVNFENIPEDALVYTITTNINNPGVFPPYLTSGTNFVGANGVGYYVFSSANGTNGTTGTNGFFGYGDYVAFLAFVKTNNPAAVQAAYPGVIISSYTWTSVISTYPSYSAYYTNPVGSVYGAPPILVLVTNYTPYFQFQYNYQFANVFTNQLLFPTHYTTKGTALNITATVGTPVGSVYGAPSVTNYTKSTMTVTNADFFVLPPFYTNFCPIAFINTNSYITNVLAITNGLAFALTNTSTTNYSAVYYTVTYFTNYSYVVEPTTCSANFQPDYYQGIEKIQFVKVSPQNYDSGSGLFVVPITNNYTMVSRNVTNGTLQVQYLQRIVTTPDVVIGAADLTSGGVSVVPSAPSGSFTNLYDVTYVLNNLAGPGLMVSRPVIRLNKSGPVFFNSTVDTMDGSTYFQATPETGSNTNLFYSYYFVFGSFDGTTNAPLVFPSGQSIANQEMQMLVTISPTDVPSGTGGVDYGTVQFTASGGGLQSPLTWTATGLPDGLSLSTDGVLSGTPTTSGIYDFTLIVTDTNGLSLQWVYPITIQ